MWPSSLSAGKQVSHGTCGDESITYVNSRCIALRGTSLVGSLQVRCLLLLMALAFIAGCAMSPGSARPATPQPMTTIAATPPTTTPMLQASAAAVKAARLRLTRNGLENPDLVSVRQMTPTIWSDDCLGLPSGITCHPTPTLGYAIELERGGQRYLLHSDQDGKQARLAQSPTESLSDAFIHWQYSDGEQCRGAVIGTDRMQFGICGEAMLGASSRASMWSDIHGQNQATYLKQRYTAFTANTIRGTLTFTGTGTTMASEAQQRAIAEWALNRFADASVGYLPADYGLRLFWLERSASLCGGLWIYQTGLAVAWNCEGSKALDVDFLSAKQLQQFYTWLDGGKRWDVERRDQGVRKPPSLVLYFQYQFSRSEARENATADEIDQMLRFAREVYAGLTRGS